jgi:hypothetical protein
MPELAKGGRKVRALVAESRPAVRGPRPPPGALVASGIEPGS